jgi:hypothetical protein
MTRRILLAGLASLGFARERHFEAFCTDEHGEHRAVTVSDWLALPELRSVVGNLTPEFPVSFGIREMVRTPFVLTLEAKRKEWRLSQPPTVPFYSQRLSNFRMKAP